MNERSSSRSAFTVVELLVIVGVIAVLGTLLVPGHAKGNKSQVLAVRCLDNHAQLIKAWQMYAIDSNEYVAHNFHIPGTYAAIARWRSNTVAETWAPNLMAFGAAPSSALWTYGTNTTLAQAGLLVRYHGSIDAYRCPADNYLSRAQKAAGWKHRARSVAMNSNWGRSDPAEPVTGITTSWAYGSAFRQWHRLAEVRRPASMFVFVDEHADSVNDGFFLATFGGGGGGEVPATSPSGMWGDIPGFYHNKGTPFAFADGHTEMKKWLSATIPVRADGTFMSGPADMRDQQWYVQRVAERR